MTGLMHHEADGGYERCVRCGAPAVGPCARCALPVCGDCCVLTEGGSRTYAICLECDRRGGRSLRDGWITVLGWFLVPILALFALSWLLSRLAGR
jgi:hypothetical protein